MNLNPQLDEIIQDDCPHVVDDCEGSVTHTLTIDLPLGGGRGDYDVEPHLIGYFCMPCGDEMVRRLMSK